MIYRLAIYTMSKNTWYSDPLNLPGRSDEEMEEILDELVRDQMTEVTNAITILIDGKRRAFFVHNIEWVTWVKTKEKDS